MTRKELKLRIAAHEQTLAHCPPFDRPLTLGDPEQLAAMAAMNGDQLYCSHCYATSGWPVGWVGDRCPDCRKGDLLPGASMDLREFSFLARDKDHAA